MKAKKAAKIMQQAMALHQRGDIAGADRLYTDALALTPRDPELLYLAGAAAFQCGRPDEAVERLSSSLERRPAALKTHEALATVQAARGAFTEALRHFRAAAELNPGSAVAHFNVGRILMDMHDAAAASDSFARAAALQPDSADMHFARAVALRILGRLEDAAGAYQRAVQLQPGRAEAWDQWGAVLYGLGRYEDAKAKIEEALALAPGNAVTHTNLGRTLLALGRVEEAKAAHGRAIALKPDFAEAHNNLGLALVAAGDAAAAGSFGKAIALNPNFADAHSNLGAFFQTRGDPDQALPHLQRAVSLAPGHAEAQFNLASALDDLGRHQEALDRYRALLAANAGHVAGHVNLALANLADGHLEEGWRGYEWRWRKDSYARYARPFSPPLWGGGDVAGSLLVWGEQGVGDEVLYAGMIPDLLERGLDVVVECDPRLVALFGRSFAGAVVVGRTEPPSAATQAPGIAAQSPAGSLGRWLRPSLESFPARRRYLVADGARTAGFRTALREAQEGPGGPVVGISWSSRNPAIGAHKSTPLRAWEPILGQAGVTFVDLQYGETAGERRAVQEALGVEVRHLPEVDLFGDLDGLAALIAACDLVITVSNTTAHLAGALGVPTWVLVPAGAGQLWYWFTDRHSSPWYPAITIFRQTRKDKWDMVVDDVAAALSARAASAP